MLEDKTIESLVIKLEAYGKTNLEILKLKSVAKTADVSSRLLSRSFLLITLSFFGLFINIGLSFWLGELLGKVYYGFAVVAGFYLLLSILLMIIHRSFVRRMTNYVISQLID